MPNGLHNRLLQRNDRRRLATYRMQEATIDRLNDAAERLQVGVSDLADDLLGVALDQLASGDLEVPTRPIALKRIDRRRV